MRYSKVQKKITCGDQESITDEVVYFHFDGYEKTTISVWLSNTSIFHVLKCFFKSWRNKKSITERAVNNIDLLKKIEKHTHELLLAYQKLADKNRSPKTQEDVGLSPEPEGRLMAKAPGGEQ